MAKKISQLTQATEVKSDDVTVIVQDGETKKLPLNMMVTKQDIENKKVAGLAKLDEIEATYENDTYTPTITVENKSSVKTGEGDEVDYSANVMDGHVKSAILKGQTLVNVLDYKALTNSNPGASYTYDGKYLTNPNTTDYSPWNDMKSVSNLIKPNTNYFVMLYNPSSVEVRMQMTFLNSADATKESFSIPLGERASYKVVSPSNANGLYLKFFPTNTATPNTKLQIMILEYQQGMENWDIPYFEGMQSVKMPVLKATGKNLFNINQHFQTGNIGGIGSSLEGEYVGGYWQVTDFIKLDSNTDYYVSTNNLRIEKISFYDINKKVIKGMAVTGINTRKISTSNNTGYIRIVIQKKDEGALTYNELVANNDIQLEQGTVLTSYEPYKTNILSTSEDVELRGIGDVKDELDCLTGEVVERIGEVVLDGSENWEYVNQTFRTDIIKDKVSSQNNTTKIYVICDRYGSRSYASPWNTGEFISLHTNKQIVIRDENFTSSNEWKEHLSQNPITVQYHLATESIKTVDLMPSGTHPSTTPYCWKNGHIQLSSSGLLPSLEYSVVTSRAGQINQNATMIVKNDKRIFDLEILLAGGLVNTTYQALTLQNQVETGLSKVSLNSETEPDYLLYHMIMKLIEEKAYKLDDLTEKVSVFYLYEKLSDEQFETIYSALYPFVEDEIVEEPVVEELSEVVEDEVIM